MSGKKQAFKDILRNCFPIVLDDLLDKKNQDITDLGSTNTKTGTTGGDYDTESLIDKDTVSPDDTVSRRDTVSPDDTVSFQDTVPRDDPAFSPDTHLSSVTIKDYHFTDITNNFFKMDADVYDVLAKFQTPFERVVYLYLYRQSYGYNRQTCFTGLKPIIEWSQLSKNVVRRVLDSLERKQHIKRIGRVNEKDVKGTSYKIYLPCEIPGLTSLTVFTLFKDDPHSST
ncbi:MAG: hypothetical protein ACP5VS_00125 [Desulfomonilaceae bacterium]